MGKGFKHGGGGTFGVTVLNKTGTLTTNFMGAASVNVGFKPDFVAFDGGTYEDIQSFSGAMFTEANKETLGVSISPPSTSDLLTVLRVTRSDSGFSLTAQKLSTSFSQSSDTNRRLNYVALKYTE